MMLSDFWPIIERSSWYCTQSIAVICPKRLSSERLAIVNFLFVDPDCRQGRCALCPSWKRQPTMCTGAKGLQHVLSVLNMVAYSICGNLRTVIHFSWLVDISGLSLWVCTVRSEQGSTNTTPRVSIIYFIIPLLCL